jgi:glycosyltransferase involved in cell wall biosynthesis
VIEIVVPLYNEEENVPELRRRLKNACSASNETWRVTFVDDGSKDRTPELLRALALEDPRFRVIELSRNFGQQAAIAAGLSQVEADAVILLDGDLQDPPELIPQMVDAWRGGAQVVLARRTSRQETGLRRLGFEMFHRIYKHLIDVEVPSNTGTYSLLDSEALDALRNLPETHRFFPGLRAWIGFDQAFVDYDRQERYKGSPKQTIKRLFRYASDGILSFSFKPLRLMTVGGFAVCAGALLAALIFVGKRILGLETAPVGFTTLSCAIFGLGGAQLIGMGILGEYIGRIYEESKNRPLFITRQETVKKRMQHRSIAA